MSRITTQEIQRSQTSPIHVPTSPVDTPTNPFSPTHVDPASYPGETSSQLPTHYLPRDKGKQKQTSPFEPVFPSQLFPGPPPGGDGDNEPGDGDDDNNGNPPNTPNPPGPPGPPPPPPPRPFGPGIATPAPIPHVPNGKERGNKPEPFTDVKKFESFYLAYIIYLLQNNSVYPTDQDKILFILSLMNDGVPGEWMKHWMAQLIAGRQHMPTYNEFNKQLEE